jgi:hypothetical protein
MRFLILNTDYPAFLDDLYRREPGLAERSFEEQLRVRWDTLFGVADFYSYNLRLHGHDAHDLLVNNEALQRSWAREHGTLPAAPRRTRAVAASAARRILRRRSRRAAEADAGWFYGILEQQLEHYRPDVLLNQDIGRVDLAFLDRLRPCFGLLVGQIASPIPEGREFGRYDLMLSSLPNLVEHFRQAGVRAELHRLGFDPRVLARVPPAPRTISCSFVGSILPSHAVRLELLEFMSEHSPLEAWLTGLDTLPESSPLRSRYRGRAWGAEMYSILGRSHVTLNTHLDVSGPYANNMRLYEATGSGALLVTDEKADLAELFAPGEEVATYRTPAECRDVVAHYLRHPEEAEAVGRAGQRRTLAEHTYERRMAELVTIVERYA